MIELLQTSILTRPSVQIKLFLYMKDLSWNLIHFFFLFRRELPKFERTAI